MSLRTSESSGITFVGQGSSSSRRERVPLVIAVLVFLGAAVQLSVGGDLLIAHLVLIGLIGWALVRALGNRVDARWFDTESVAVVAVVTVATAGAGLAFGLGSRAVSEYTKIFLLFAGAAALRILLGAGIFRILPLVIGASLLGMGISAARASSLYTYDHRLVLPDWGSPNALGAACMVIALLALFMRTRTFVGRAAAVAVAAIMTYVIVATNSRGALLSLFAGLLVGVVFCVRKWHRVYVVLAVGCVFFVCAGLAYASGMASGLLDKFAHADDISTGRFEIWGVLLADMARQPLSFLTGFGPGSIDLPLFNKTVVSAHSMPVSFLTYFGIPGVLVLAWWFARRMVTAFAEPTRVIGLRLGLLAALAFSCLTDAIFLSSQLIFLGAFAFAVVGQPAADSTVGRPWPAGTPRGRRSPVML